MNNFTITNGSLSVGNASGESGIYYFNNNSRIPQRKGKQFTTTEECLKENGEHVWSESFDPSPNISCAVMHYGESCDWHDPRQICYHCPAERNLVITQREKKEWI